jgi:hypothetical protein
VRCGAVLCCARSVSVSNTIRLGQAVLQYWMHVNAHGRVRRWWWLLRADSSPLKSNSPSLMVRILPVRLSWPGLGPRQGPQDELNRGENLACELTIITNICALLFCILFDFTGVRWHDGTEETSYLHSSDRQGNNHSWVSRAVAKRPTSSRNE